MNPLPAPSAKGEEMKEPKLFDVVIVEIATRKVESIAGTRMERDKGFYNAEKRLETVISRINEDYFASIVPAEKYQVGDLLK